MFELEKHSLELGRNTDLCSVGDPFWAWKSRSELFRMNILFQFIELVFISEIFTVEIFYSRNGGLTAKYIIDHLMYRISLENTAYLLREKHEFKIT